MSTEIAPRSDQSPSDDALGREYQVAFPGGPGAPPDDPPSELQPGSKLGERYTIVRKLGQGGMGVVYEAQNANVEHIRYAIKTLLPNSPKTDADHFLQEARRASKVRSKHIVRISDFGTDSGSGLTYMVMDFVGGDLEGYLRARGGTLSPHQAIEFCVQVCEALVAAHAEKVVHRDIKPHNCLIHVEAGQEVLVLADFGIAREFRTASSSDSGEQTNSVWTAIGTLGYIAPEVFLREGGADHRVDIYSVGAMLVRMLVGHAPPLAPTAAELTKLGIPDVLLPVLGTALARYPKDRYPSAKSLQSALREAQGSFAAAPVAPPQPPVSRRSLFLTVALAAATATFVYVLWSRRTEPMRVANVPSVTVPEGPATPPESPPTKVDEGPKRPPVTPPDTPPEKAPDPMKPVLPGPIETKTGPVVTPAKKPKWPKFAAVARDYEDRLREFCKQGIQTCASKLEIKKQDLYRGKGSYFGRLGFTFSADAGPPVAVQAENTDLILKDEKPFKDCVDRELRKLGFSPTSDGGEFSCRASF